MKRNHVFGRKLWFVSKKSKFIRKLLWWFSFGSILCSTFVMVDTGVGIEDLLICLWLRYNDWQDNLKQTDMTLCWQVYADWIWIRHGVVQIQITNLLLIHTSRTWCCESTNYRPCSYTLDSRKTRKKKVHKNTILPMY